jgi:signal transduction histidine kinase
MSVRRFDTQNRVRAVGIHAQSTEFTPAEAILPHQQEMLSQREKLAAMSSLLASMAHELNNFLTVIMIQSELLLKEAADRPLVERATPSNDAAERCVRIVRNCLMLARQHSPERTQVQLNLIHRGSPPLVRLCTTAGQH